MRENGKIDLALGLFERQCTLLRKTAAILGVVAVGSICTSGNCNAQLNLEKFYNHPQIEYVGQQLDHPARIGYDNQAIVSKNRLAKKAAEECGLTLVNPTKTLQELQNSKDVLSSFSVLKNYLKQFDIDATIVTGLDSIDAHYPKYFTDQTLLNEEYIEEFVPFSEFKESMRSIIESLQFTPKEYIELSGIKELRITKSFNHQTVQIGDDKKAIDGLSAFNDRVVYLSMYSIGHVSSANDTFFHEIGHFIDRDTGGYLSDIPYGSLNPVGFRYSSTAQIPLDSLPTFDRYGADHSAEDRASILAQFNKFNNPVLFSQNPYIRAKARLILARVNAKIPNIAKYYGLLHRF